MEAALKAPPLLLEKLVVMLIPPAARETMAGDLWERYRSPAQYLGEALSTLPFVVASQMRRNVSLPVLGLQSLLVFFCLGGGGAALPVTAGFSLLLLLQAAYQGTHPPPPARAALETVILAVIIAAMCAASVREHTASGWIVTRQPLGIIVPFLLPMLCIFRARLIADWEERRGFSRSEINARDMAHLFRRDRKRAVRRNRIEAMAFLIAALVSALALRPFFPDHVLLSMSGLYLCAAAYLVLSAPARPLPAKAGLLQIRALYQEELARQDRLRRLMWWLWLTPALFAIHLNFIGAGLKAGDLRLTISGIGMAALLCFVIGSINRERGGRIRETILQLSTIREAKTA